MRRYDMEYFNKLNLSVGVKLIHKAFEDIDRQRAWDVWVSAYPYMDKNNYVPFEKFYKPNDYSTKTDHKSTDELLALVKDTETKVREGKYREVSM